MLILLVGEIFILPLAQFATWGRIAARAVISLIIISGVIATLDDRRIVLPVIAFTFGSLSIGLRNFERPNLYLNLFNDLSALLLLGFLIVLIVRQILRAGPITWRRVQGSIAVYLLLGVLWSVGYEIIELMQPGSFTFTAQKDGTRLPQFAYFSFTTLTTLGLGDIIPIRSLARSLVMLEALVGQLFPVILIARLVTMEIEHHKRSDQP
ncbi:MAG: two pore domain potassium channel family protein [Deltaproteobacteria bacterium]|nr:two pore domain potassium channel family protein [Deltaproteobacteria bacterium]